MSWPFLSPSLFVNSSERTYSTQDPSTSSSAPEKLQRASSSGGNSNSPDSSYRANIPRLLYSDVSDIFTEAEYREITSCYNAKGVESWKDITANPLFHTRSTQVKDLCEKLENFNVTQSYLRLGRESIEMIEEVSTKRNNLRRILMESSTTDNSCNSSLSSPWTPCDSLEEFSPQHSGSLAAERAPSKLESKRDSSMGFLSPNTTSAYSKKSRKIKRAKSTSSSSSYGSANSARSRSSRSSHAGEFPYAYPSAIPGPKHQSFYDSDDYSRRKAQSPVMQPTNTTTEYSSPLSIDAPPLPFLSPTSPSLLSDPLLTCTCHFSSSKLSPVHPTSKRRGFSHLFHIFRRHKKA